MIIVMTINSMMMTNNHHRQHDHDHEARMMLLKMMTTFPSAGTRAQWNQWSGDNCGREKAESLSRGDDGHCDHHDHHHDEYDEDDHHDHHHHGHHDTDNNVPMFLTTGKLYDDHCHVHHYP